VTLPKERKAFAALLPLFLWTAAVIGAMFCIHGGHRSAFILSPNKLCTDKFYAPVETRVPWGSRHGAPLVVLQISDLHISDQDADDEHGKRNFRRFVRDIIPLFAPVADAVLVSGDLVSAKQNTPGFEHILGYHSLQSVSEWKWYNATAQVAKASFQGVWITVPGNHDVFGSSDRRLYREYTGTGGERVHVTRIRGHKIIALDTTLSPSPHRPLNFFGMIDATIAAALRSSLVATADDGDGAAIIVGHFPSAVMSAGRTVRNAVADAAAASSFSSSAAIYLSGHLHTLRDLVPTGMQVASTSGHLELQLADLSSTGTFRLLAVDHGIPSWVDTRIDGRHVDKPIVLVMNPPRAGICSPGAGFAALQSTHVRLLVISSASRRELRVSVWIDGKLLGLARQVTDSSFDPVSATSRSSSSVYAVAWTAAEYMNDRSTHVMDVLVTSDRSVNSSKTRHEFSLNGVPPGGRATLHLFLAAIFTLSDFEAIARQSVYIGLVSAIAVPLYAFVVVPRRGFSWRKALAMTTFVSMILFGGPILITQHLSDTGGWGWATLRATTVREGRLVGGVDPFFAMFLLTHITILPSFYACYVTTVQPELASSWLVLILRFTSIARCVAWLLNVAGAHGSVAALISPICSPLLLLLVWCCGLPRPAIFSKRKVV
jgi:Calcineurin-like phosphoesterase